MELADGEIRAENMRAVLKMVRSKYGGAEGYLRSQCGLGDADIRRIRENMTAEVEPIL